MPRFLALALGISASAAFAAPIPQEASPGPLYYPTKVGARRVMGDGLVSSTYTVTVAEPQPDGSVRVYERVEFGKALHPYQKVLSVSPDGVFETGIVRNQEAKDIREARVLFKWQPECLVRVAGRWEWSMMSPEEFRQINRSPRTHVYEAVGVEEVVVPAGTFRATRVDNTTRDADRPSGDRFTSWWAPGVGVVQTAVNGRVLDRLLSFEPGR